MEEVKVSLEQGLRERLTFDMFANELAKKDLDAIKEENIKAIYRHVWHAHFCFTVKTNSPMDGAVHAALGARMLADLHQILTDNNYGTIANGIIKTEGEAMFTFNITEKDTVQLT